MEETRVHHVPDRPGGARRDLADHFRATGHDPRSEGLEVDLGDHLRIAADGARWLDQDDFPADQIWADEIEAVLNFAAVNGQFDRALGRLRGSARQRDATVAEFRVAFFLRRNGFRILEWEPNATGKPGDLLIQWRETPPIFVETKAPDWEGELSPDEREERKRLPKHVTGDGRAVDPVGAILDVVRENAVPKFGDSRPNLVVIHDDLFVSPAELPSTVVRDRVAAGLADDGFERVGAVCFVHPTRPLPGREIIYATLFVENESALPACRIPEPVSIGLRRSSGTPRASS